MKNSGGVEIFIEKGIPPNPAPLFEKPTLLTAKESQIGCQVIRVSVIKFYCSIIPLFIVPIGSAVVPH